MTRWHTVDNGWSRVGYHFFINKNGNIQEGCPLEKIPIAQKGYNTGSIAICVHGLKKSTFTDEQMTSVKALYKAITDSYSQKLRIRGHKEVSKKACPVFDYKAVLNLNAQGYYNDGQATTSTAENKSSDASDNTTGVTKKIKPIQLFNKGKHVMALQTMLNKLGCACLKDSLFGKNTEEAVKKFQRKKGLSADGGVGGRTIEKMFSRSDLILKKNSRGTDVQALQLMLAMFSRNVMHDGIFGDGTEKALKQQQQLMGLKVDGAFGPKSRKKMLLA